MARIVTVFGATGLQGSSVVEALLADKTFAVRAVTRNTTSEAAQKLKSRGVDVVKADLRDKTSLKEAIAGSEAVFGLTNFWDPSIFEAGNYADEIEQGKNIVDISKEVGVKFMVWSSMPSSIETSGGKYDVVHMETKYAVEKYMNESGLPGASIYTGWFAENMITLPDEYFPKSEDGSYELRVPRYGPNATNAIIWAGREVGVSSLALFKHYQDRADLILGKHFYVANARITFPEFAELLSKAIGKPVKFVTTPTSGLQELDIMYDYQVDIGLYKESSLPDPRLIDLGANFSTLSEFAEVCMKPIFA